MSSWGPQGEGLMWTAEPFSPFLKRTQNKDDLLLLSFF